MPSYIEGTTSLTKINSDFIFDDEELQDPHLSLSTSELGKLWMHTAPHKPWALGYGIQI